MTHAQYMEVNLYPDRLKKAGEGVVKSLKKYFPKADAIVVTGNSGTIISGLVSVMTGLPIV